MIVPAPSKTPPLPPQFIALLLAELRRDGHPWARPGFDGFPIAQGVSEAHLGLRSRGGVPLNGGEAFTRGFGLDCCPYRWGFGRPAPRSALWRAEWSTAKGLSRASRAEISDGAQASSDERQPSPRDEQKPPPNQSTGGIR